MFTKLVVDHHLNPKLRNQLGRKFWDKISPTLASTDGHWVWDGVGESWQEGSSLTLPNCARKMNEEKRGSWVVSLPLTATVLTFLSVPIPILLDQVDTDLASRKSVDNTPWLERWANSLHFFLFMSGIGEKVKVKALKSFVPSHSLNKNEERLGKHLHK